LASDPERCWRLQAYTTSSTPSTKPDLLDRGVTLTLPALDEQRARKPVVVLEDHSGRR
jgi:hypothetical protein